MNRGGMLAMMDAMLFVAVLMVALSVTAQVMHDGSEDGRDAGDLLDSMLSSTVRMSDLSEDGDGSLVRVSDMLALHLASGEGSAMEYAEELMESFSGGRGYRLTLTFGDLSETLGDGSGTPSATAERTVPVTTGGELSARLEIFPS